MARETLASYISEEGEHIKVITGLITRTGTMDGAGNKRFREYSTEVYVGGMMQHIYRESEIREQHIPALRPIISEAMRYKLSCEELVLSIDEKIEEIRDSEDNQLEDIGKTSTSPSKRTLEE